MDFEVYFRRFSHDFSKGIQPRKPEVDARVFKEKLEYDSTTFFGGRYFGRMGSPKDVMAVAVRHLNHTEDVDEASKMEVSASSEDRSYDERNRVSKHIYRKPEKNQDHGSTLKQQPSYLDTNEVERKAL